MFVGATLLALGYQLFMGWVTANQNVGQAGPGGKQRAVGTLNYRPPFWKNASRSM